MPFYNAEPFGANECMRPIHRLTDCVSSISRRSLPPKHRPLARSWRAMAVSPPAPAPMAASLSLSPSLLPSFRRRRSLHLSHDVTVRGRIAPLRRSGLAGPCPCFVATSAVSVCTEFTESLNDNVDSFHFLKIIGSAHLEYWGRFREFRFCVPDQNHDSGVVC